MSGPRGGWRTVCIWVGAVLALLVIAHTLMVGGTRARVEAELAHIRSRGEPVKMTDLAGPKVPRSENAAVVYQRAFDLISSSTMARYLNALDTFAPATAGPGEWARVSTALARLRPVKLIVEEAQSRPKCVFRRDWRAGIEVVFPEYSGLRELTDILGTDAVAMARAGRMQEALHSLQLCLRLDRCLRDEPVLIAALARTGNLAIVTSSLRDCLAYSDLTGPQARELYREFSRIDPRPGFVRAMQGERALGLWEFDHPEVFADENHDPARVRYLRLYPFRPLLNMDKATYLRLMRRHVETADMTALEMRKKGLGLPRHTKVPDYALITSMTLVGVIDRMGFVRDKMIAELALAQMLVALEGYRARFGRYPSSVNELQVKIGWQLRNDPFSGRLPIYRRTRKGFVLYSFGMDMDDDKGLDPNATGLDPSRDGDIVWEWDRAKGWVAPYELPPPPPSPAPPPPM